MFYIIVEDGQVLVIILSHESWSKLLQWDYMTLLQGPEKRGKRLHRRSFDHGLHIVTYDCYLELGSSLPEVTGTFLPPLRLHARNPIPVAMLLYHEGMAKARAFAGLLLRNLNLVTILAVYSK